MLRIQVHGDAAHAQEDALRAAFVGVAPLAGLRLSRVYWLHERRAGALQALADQVDVAAIFHDPVSETASLGTPELLPEHTWVEVRHRAGVTDNLARTATEALMIAAGAGAAAGTGWQDWDVSVHSGWQLALAGACSEADVQQVLYRDLANPLLHELHVASSAALQAAGGWFVPPVVSTASGQPAPELALFPLELAALQHENDTRGLALSTAELQAIIDHFGAHDAQRAARGWQGRITEVELECIAQSWSEHCKHKIFAADIAYSEDAGACPGLGAQQVSSLYKRYIQQPTCELADCGYLVSVFSDNAGVVDFDPQINVCIKVETHNSPSALDPYGGAITGILGVNRDIIGTGLGARPVANMDVFCLSTADRFPPPGDARRPTLLKDPAVIFRGVHKGVEDGGNQSGIPTVNGGLRFDSEYGGKPLVFVGSVGVMPKQVHGRASHEKTIVPGDRIVVAGGRVGKDGVHGATFSSLALSDGVAPNVVQIGDPITQKRLLDFTLAARDAGLIRAITDNGAGGLSSSIGEMAELCGGARLDLARHGVKYAGLAYWELLVSESQERMSYAVAPEHEAAFMALAARMGVEAWVLGRFSDSGWFEVHHGARKLARLQLDFLHHGVPRMRLQAHWDGPQPYTPFYRAAPRQPEPAAWTGLPRVLLTLLASPNVASREFMVRRYDHEVQGATRLKPFTGRHQATPSAAAVLDLHTHGGAPDNALVLAHGLCPQFSAFDTWLMAQKAVDAALRNVVAAGGDPARAALVDNFCWPDPLPGPGNPDARHKLAQLVRACAGLADAARAFRAPFVSGKDSMKNDFVGQTLGGAAVRISVPPTLLVTAIAQNPRAQATVSPHFKRAGDRIAVLGTLAASLYGSVYAYAYDAAPSDPPYPDLAGNARLYARLHGLMQRGLVASCQGVHTGGLLASAVTACFGNRLGMALDLSALQWPQLFSEAGSLFLLSARPEHAAALQDALGDALHWLGHTTAEFSARFSAHGTQTELDLAQAQRQWSDGIRTFYDA